MITERTLLIFLAIVLLGCVVISCATTSPVTPTTQSLPTGQGTVAITPLPPVTATTPSAAVTQGEALFKANCVTCHVSPNKTAPDLGMLGAERIRQTVRQGKGGMPQFSESELSSADLESIIAYLTSLN